MLHGKRKKMRMKNRAFDLSSYTFRKGEKILVDTNIWLYLFPAPSNPAHPVATQYSNAFSSLIAAKAQPILDPMVLGEYLNRYARIEWEGLHKVQYPSFKQFRNSSDFQAVASSIETFARKILRFCEVHTIAPNQLDLQQALSDFTHGHVDFTDAILIDICKKCNIKIMTNDGDFQDGGLEVLTTNPRLLQACPCI